MFNTMEKFLIFITVAENILVFILVILFISNSLEKKELEDKIAKLEYKISKKKEAKYDD